MKIITLKYCNCKEFASLLKGRIRCQISTILFLFFITLTSCDCITEGYGVVVDSDTNLPLDSVVAKSYINKVKAHAYEGEMLTDETGTFSGSTGLTGGFFGCPNLVVEFSKNGYNTLEVTNPHDTIRLIKK
jgi:hypothetical protein